MARNGMAYTEKEIGWIRTHIDDAAWPVLAAKFNARFPRRERTVDGLQTTAATYGIHKRFAFYKGTLYSDEMKAFLRANRNGRRVSELTAMFNDRFGCSLSPSAIEAALHRLSVRRKDSATRKPIGSEAVKKGFVYLKVTDTYHDKRDWVLKHRYIYEKAHGRLGRGEVVVFLDGDRLNCSLDNLVHVSKYVGRLLRIYGWFFIGQKQLQECAIKWCECAEYIKTHYNPDFCLKEWERRI